MKCCLINLNIIKVVLDYTAMTDDFRKMKTKILRDIPRMLPLENDKEEVKIRSGIQCIY